MVQLPERRDLEHPLEEPVGCDPGGVDAQLCQFVLVAEDPPERVVEVPRDELELVRFRVQVEVIVLADLENAVQRRKVDGHRHEPRKLVEVNEVADPRGHFRIGGVAHQFRQLHHPTDLPLGNLGLGVVRLLEFRPRLAHVGEQVCRHRLEDRSVASAEAVFGKVLVDVLDDRIEAQVLPVVLGGDGQVDLRVARPRRGNAGVAVEAVRDRLDHAAGVGHVVVQVQLGEAGELLTLDEVVQVQLQRPFQCRARLEKCPVAFVPHSDVVQRGFFEGHRPPHDVEVDADGRREAVALATRAAQEDGEPGLERALRVERRLQAGAQRVQVKPTGLRVVPVSEPAPGE